jgi:lambda repressor-like predicted transcriptional regulator
MSESDSTAEELVEYRTIKRLPDCRFGTDGSVWVRKGKGPWMPVATFKNGKGYLTVRIRVDGRSHFVQVHRLILEAFDGPCPPGYEARHFPDPDRTNNRPQNLSWATRKKNHYDKKIQGTQCAGETHGRAKLTWKKVHEARKLYKQGTSIGDLAEKYGIDWSTMRSALVGKTWKPSKHVAASSDALD